MSKHKASITPNEKIRKQKFIMALLKQHFSSDMLNMKKTLNNIKYQTDTELSNKYWNIISANKSSNISWIWEPANHATKIVNDVSYVSMKSGQSLYTETRTC